jgi:hypothetical protein
MGFYHHAGLQPDDDGGSPLKRTSSVQVTQKSFSMFCFGLPSSRGSKKDIAAILRPRFEEL